MKRSRRFKRLAIWIPLVVALGLFWLASPWVRVRDEDDMRLQAVSDLKQIALGLETYHEVYGKYPPAVVRDKDGKPLYSWRVAILPFIEQDALYREFTLDEPWDGPHNIRLLEKVPPVYAPFEEAGPGKTYYQVFVGPGTAFEKEGLTRKDFLDGLDKTLFVIEAGEAVPWTKPVDLTYDPGKPLPSFQSHHGKPVYFWNRLLYRTPCFHVATGEAKVYALPFPCDETMLRAMLTRNGGEALTLPPPN